MNEPTQVAIQSTRQGISRRKQLLDYLSRETFAEFGFDPRIFSRNLIAQGSIARNSPSRTWNVCEG